MRKKALSLLLSLAMLFGLCTPSAFAVGSYGDTQGHWAEEAIEKWSEYGIVTGYGDNFGPDDSITRGQMAAILSRTLNLIETAENPFSDVPLDAWYTPYILHCYAAGIMQGDGANANPEAIITRQEAMTMLCRAFAITPAENADLSLFTDGMDTADWAMPFVAALVNNGIVGGIGDGLLAPTGSMSRAAVVAVIDRTVVQYITEAGEYELTGDNGLILVAAGDVTLTGETAADVLVTPAADGKMVTFNDAVVTGAITVQADYAEITVKTSTLPEITMVGEGCTIVDTATEDNESEDIEEDNNSGPIFGGGGYIPTIPSVPSGPSDMTITESKTVSGGAYQNVTITDAVGDGEVTLSGLTIQGDLTIKGGGSNSVKLENCTVAGKVVMAKTSGEAPRLYLTNTPITKVEAQQPAIIEADDTASIVTAVEATAAVEIKGENTAVATITVPAGTESTVTITVTAGTVETIAVKSDATIAGAVGSVVEVVAEAPVSVASDAVEKVEVPATAPADVAVTVTGTSAIEVTVNSENGVAISSGSATVELSTELESIPNVTVDDTPVTHIHKWNSGEVTAAATCEGTGVKTYSCTVEGCTDPVAAKTETIPALGHNYGDWSLSDNDNHSRVCANDANHVETAAHTWDDGVQTTAPTCDNDGAKTYTCATCTSTKTEAIAAPGHNYGEWTKVDATNHQRICENDASHIETEAHTAVDDAAVGATCTESGLTVGSHCSVCNGVIVEQTIVDALGHDFTGAYTSDTDGHWHVCARDNCEETDTKTAHTYNTSNCAEEATCACGYTKAAGEHAWNDGEVTTEPTCEGEGVKTYTCGSCSTTKTEAITATGHTWGDWTKVDDTNHTRTCGNDSTHTETAAHSWNNGVVTTEPTETTEGIKTYTCTSCDATKTESVPKVTAASVSIYATSSILRLDWDAKEGYNGTYYVDGKNTYSAGPFYHLINTVRSATEAGSYSFTVATTEDNGATLTEWVTAENVLTVVFDETSQPDVSIVGQSDGTYKFVPNNDFAGIYDYTLYAPDGSKIYSFYVAANECVKVSPYEGCYFVVRGLSWPTGRRLPSVTATVSAEKQFSYTPYDFTNVTVTITEDSESALNAALNAGGKVILESDITITSSSYNTVNRGGDVELDLNGHTITLNVNLYINYGKAITFTDSSEDKTGKILGTIIPGSECSVTFDGVTLTNESGYVMNGSNARSIVIQNSTLGGISLNYVDNIQITGSTLGTTNNVSFLSCDTVSISNTEILYSMNIAGCKTAEITSCSFRFENETDTMKRVSISKECKTVFDDVSIKTGAAGIHIAYAGAQLTINSGTYEYTTGSGTIPLFYLFNADDNALVINGGTFVGFDPSAYVNTETHTVIDNGDGTWTVTAISE